MPEHDHPFTEAVSDLANALQIAAPLADRLRVTAAQQQQDAETLHAAVERAVEALPRLRRRPEHANDDPRRI